MTINELVVLFQSLSQSHKQISSFAFGVGSDIDISNIVYPQVYAEIEAMSLNGKDLIIPFSFIISDRVAKDKRNELDIISDMTSVALDFRAMLSDPVYFDLFVFENDAAITSFVDSTDSETAGVVFDFKIKLTDIKDRCQIPV